MNTLHLLRTTALAALLSAAGSLSSHAQAVLGHVPPAVQSAYAARFTTPAPTPTWDHRTGGRWNAAYRQADSRAAVATFTNAGEWVQTSTVTPASELPAPARAHIVAQKLKKPVRHVARIEHPDGSITWKARANGNVLLFDHTGHLLRTGEAPRVAAKRAKRAVALMPAEATPTPPIAKPVATEPAEKVAVE